MTSMSWNRNHRVFAIRNGGLKMVRAAVAWSALLACFLLAEQSAAGELKAGAARVDLTPSLELNAPLGGYGERMNRPAEGIHDRIYAKALVLASGDKKFVLVTADIVGFPPPVKPA